MKERPILFSTSMVQAIQNGRKTQTRRTKGLNDINVIPFDNGLDKYPYQREGEWYYQLQTAVDDSAEYKLKCPYGQAGDVLWVRETWKWEGDTKHTDLVPIGSFYYKADFEEHEGPAKWKPSIFMPREACRIKLEITKIRVERVHDITEEDAKLEGVQSTAVLTHSGDDYTGLYASEHFQDLWDSINIKRCPWSSNPWVWVIEFKKI